MDSELSVRDLMQPGGPKCGALFSVDKIVNGVQNTPRATEGVPMSEQFTGPTQHITGKVPTALVERLDRIASAIARESKVGVAPSRSAVLRRALELGCIELEKMLNIEPPADEASARVTP